MPTCSIILLLTLTLELASLVSCRHMTNKAPLSRFCYAVYKNGTEVRNPCYPGDLLECEAVLQALLPKNVKVAAVCKAKPCWTSFDCPSGSMCTSTKPEMPREYAEKCGLMNLYYAEKWNKFMGKQTYESPVMRCSLPGAVMVERKACKVVRAKDRMIIREQSCRSTLYGKPVKCSTGYSCRVDVEGETVYLFFCPKSTTEQITGDEHNKDDEEDVRKGFDQKWKEQKEHMKNWPKHWNV